MAETCRSYAHRYIGKGAERKLYEGPCVLELGHDMDHLPYALAQEQQQNQAFNAGVQAMGDMVVSELLDRLKKRGVIVSEDSVDTVMDEVSAIADSVKR